MTFHYYKLHAICFLPLYVISNQIKTFVEGIDLISVYIIDFYCAHIFSVLFLVYLHCSD